MPIPSKGQLGQMANSQFSDPRQNQNLAGFPAGAKPSMVGQTMPAGRPPTAQIPPGMVGPLSQLFPQGRPNPVFGQPGLAGTMGRPQIPPGGKYPGGFPGPPQRMPIPPGQGLPQPGTFPGYANQGGGGTGMGGWSAMPQLGPQAGPMRAPLPGQMPPGGAGMGGPQQKPPQGPPGGGMQPGGLGGGK